MEKRFRPIPDVGSLKYHGTPENPDIKIFVSHRIDLDSEPVDNPLYISVRCGAVYDKRKGIQMLGDNTGDNISSKRDRFGELTILYWAWKNIKADYYGLVHYRRYLMYTKKQYKTAKEAGSSMGLVYCPDIQTAKEIGDIDKEEIMRRTIQNNKILVLEPYDLKENGISSIQDNIYLDATHYDQDALDIMVSLIRERYPNMIPAVKRFLKQSKVSYYNLFVMETTIFNEYCSFLFDILFELEKRIDFVHYNPEKQRIVGYFAELLLGIFINAKYKHQCEYLQGVFIDRHGRRQSVSPAYKENNVVAVFSSSDFFVPYLGVSLSSLIRRSSEKYNYDIIVLEKNITARNKMKLKALVEGMPNFSLRFIDVKKYIYKTKFYLPENNPEMAEETYYTVLVPWVMENYAKALILDCDIVICRDIAELFFTDLKGDNLGAAKEYLFQGFLNNPYINTRGSLTAYCRKTLEMPDEYNYYNAGVLLCDLAAFRNKFTLDNLLDQISKNKFNIVEQDLLNKICCGQILDIGYEWNFMACISPETIPQIALVSSVEQKRYEDAKKNIGILHYITRDKPWKYPDLQYADLWWKECRETEFYEICLYRMMENSAQSATRNLAKSHVSSIDSRSGARKFADKLLPRGTRRREFAKKLLPKNSLRWRFCKWIYCCFKPQYR